MTPIDIEPRLCYTTQVRLDSDLRTKFRRRSDHALHCHATDHAALLCVVLQLGTLYTSTYLHRHPVSAAISKLNFFAGRIWH